MKIKRVIASVLSAALIFSNVGMAQATDTQVIEAPMEMEETASTSEFMEEEIIVSDDVIVEETPLSNTEIFESETVSDDIQNKNEENLNQENIIVQKNIEQHMKISSYANITIPDISKTQDVSKVNKLEKVENIIGHYQFNIAGCGVEWHENNIPFSSGTSHIAMCKPYEGTSYCPGGNSSGSYLDEKYNIGGSIYKAYLVIETARPDKIANIWKAPITLLYAGKDGKSIKSGIKSTCNYFRYNNSYGTGWIDVTDFVKRNGYGWYYGCNIPFSIGSGDEMSSWKLVVIEENKQIPIRNLFLNIGNFDVNGASAISTIEGTGITTKKNGKVTGQFLFAVTNSDPLYKSAHLYYSMDKKNYTKIFSNNNVRQAEAPVPMIMSRNAIPLQKDVNWPNHYYFTKTYKSNTSGSKAIYTQTYSPEYPEVTGDDIELFDITETSNPTNIILENNKTSVSLKFSSDRTLGLELMGLAVDIDYPVYNTTQIVNGHDTDKATITGTTTNISTTTTGIGLNNGTIKVSVDKGLKILSTSAFFTDVNGTKINLPSSMYKIDLNNNTITYTFGKDSNGKSMVGESLTYTIETIAIEADNPNGYKLIANNEVQASGYLISNNIVTDFYMDNVAWDTSSITIQNAPKVTLNDLIIKPNGGSYNNSTSDTTIKNVQSKTVQNLSNPVRDGYTFMGWGLTSGNGASLNGNKLTMGYETTVVTANWEINSYTLTVNPNGGVWNNNSNTQTFTLNYKGTKDIPTPTPPNGYIFNGWSISGNGLLNGTTFTMNNQNTTLTAQWAPVTVKYVVNHYQQNLADDNYTLKDIENLTGTTATSVTPNTKTYTGFTSPTKQTVTIKADGSTVVNYYYTRNSYTVTLNKGTGIATVSGSGTYKYGASVTINATLNAGYQWSKWSGTHNTTTQQYTFTMPANNVTDTANASLIPYTITYTLDGGSATNPTSYNVETTTFTLTNPTKIGYTFTGWTGSNGSTPQTTVSIAKGSIGNKSYTANWKVNQYPVTYIDVVDSTSGKELGRSTVNKNYGSTVRGADTGSDKTDNKYYIGYGYVSDTSTTVGTSGTTVYRIFKYLTIDKTSIVTWNDNNNADGFRPDEYTLKLKQNGKVIKEVKLPSSQSNYTFKGLDKYDSNGNAYNYTFDIDATDRYKISIDENGNIIVNDYQKASFSVEIPKKISLNGMIGQGTYDVKVKGTFFYNDTLTVTPTAKFTMKDKSNIKTMQATVEQSKTSFKLPDGVNTGASTKGTIKLDRSQFAGSWNGTFNFTIKFTMSN